MSSTTSIPVIYSSDLCDSGAQIIAHQCNCKGGSAKGLSKTMFKRFPYANVYGKDVKRKLGSIKLCGKGVKKGERYVIAMFAQALPGKPSGSDSTKKRIAAFKSCLDKIGKIKPLKSVAFPLNIGCGNAGGDWDVYHELLKEWSEKHPRTEITLVSNEAEPDADSSDDEDVAPDDESEESASDTDTSDEDSESEDEKTPKDVSTSSDSDDGTSSDDSESEDEKTPKSKKKVEAGASSESSDDADDTTSEADSSDSEATSESEAEKKVESGASSESDTDEDDDDSDTESDSSETEQNVQDDDPTSEQEEPSSSFLKWVWHSLEKSGLVNAEELLSKFESSQQDEGKCVPSVVDDGEDTVKDDHDTVGWEAMSLKEYVDDNVPDGWEKPFERVVPEIKTISKKLKAIAGDGSIYPTLSNVFTAFDLCHLDDLKVIILGQDPYPTGKATGLAFSHSTTLNKKGECKLQPSLKNIYTALKKDGFDYDKSSADLSAWAVEGVLLLNTALTITSGKKGSHITMWKDFVKKLLVYLSAECDHLVVMLWGAKAQEYSSIFGKKKHLIIKAPHPAASQYDSKNTEFFDHKPFSKANKALKKWGMDKVDWDLS